MKVLRTIGVFMLIVLGSFSVHALGGRDSSGRGSPDLKPLIAVSIQPQAYFVQRLAGDRMELLTLVGPGQSPHSYEPTPRQMADLSRAQAWFTIGVDFENALKPKITALYPGLRLVDTTLGIKFRSLEAHSHDDHDEQDDHDEELGARDPHVWLGRDSVKVQVGHILAALSALDPEGSSSYKANHDAFLREIDTLFEGLAKRLAPLRGKPVFVFHPAFGYFFDEFGIIQEAVETGGKEPTQRTLAALIEKARKEGASTIFVQTQFPVNAARSIASAIGGSVVEIDPLSGDWIDNLKNMADALGYSVR